MSSSTVANVHARSQDLGRRSADAVEGMLGRRAATEGTILHAVEDGAKRAGTWMWSTVRRHSFVSVTGAGALGVALATAVGVGELAAGAAIAYACYNVWVRGETRGEALRELVEGAEVHHH